MQELDEIGYLIASEYEGQLRSELLTLTREYSGILFAKKPLKEAYWAQNLWLNPFIISITSISDAVKKLRSLGKYWILHSNTLHRRAALIQDQLPKARIAPTKFPSPLPNISLGAWMLLDSNTILCSPRTSSPFPSGIPQFEEIREGPPGRAYLKLWEILTLIGKHPQPGDCCLELGASPGGWTWALTSLGCTVKAIDRSPLAPNLMNHPQIQFIKGDAFSLKPESIGQIDWLFCDVICYPEKLYDWLQPILVANICKNFVCTLKFQGADNYAITQKFKEIPGSTIRHLFHNKHELTWALTEH